MQQSYWILHQQELSFKEFYKSSLTFSILLSYLNTFSEKDDEHKEANQDCKEMACIQRVLQEVTNLFYYYCVPFYKIFSLKTMINTKKLIKMAKKWQQRAALSRKRISFQRSNTSNSTAVEKGCFVVYTVDKTPFAFPITYLGNSVFQELLKNSEEEFGLSAEGPITLPFDSAFLEYLIKLIHQRMDGDTEKALLISISSARCSSHCSFQQQEQSNQQLHVF